MAKYQPSVFEKEFRNKFKKYLDSLENKNKKVLKEIFDLLYCIDSGIFLFGGFPLDIFLKGNYAIPRDIDIVVTDGNLNSLINLFTGYKISKTRLGGYKINYKGLGIDIWHIENTWAFENNIVKYKNINTLGKTTFLNIESIAIELNPGKQHQRRILYDGFLKALNENCIEINLEENPSPELNIARLIHAAQKLNKPLGPKLLNYISKNLNQFDINRILLIYEKRYGILEREKEIYKDIFAKIQENKNAESLSKVKDNFLSEQLNLFEKNNIRSPALAAE